MTGRFCDEGKEHTECSCLISTKRWAAYLPRNVDSYNEIQGKVCGKGHLFFIKGNTNWSNFPLEKFGSTITILRVHQHQHINSTSSSVSYRNTQQMYTYRERYKDFFAAWFLTAKRIKWEY